MRVLFVGGGTLGSVTPLLAVAEEFQRQKKTPGVFFWGTRNGPEPQLIEAAGIPFRSLPAGKLRRYWDLRNILDLVVVKWAFWVALIRLIRERPSVVVGAGSFVQVPVMWAAALLRIPIIIHQLDVRPSLANRLVAPFARHITAVFQESARALGRRVAVIGNPVRRAVLNARRRDSSTARHRFGLPADVPVLFVLGGGTGAQKVNLVVQRSLPALTARAFVLHVTGRGKAIDVSGYPASVRARYQQFEMLTDAMPAAYAAADLVVSRAGMGTITELAALGKPTLLIPMPGTHQEENAKAMTERGAMRDWYERYLPPPEFTKQVLALLSDTAQRATLARRSVQAFPTNAAEKIADAILRVVENKI